MLEYGGLQEHLLPTKMAEFQWGILGAAQVYLWIWVLFVILFAFSMVTAHAVIPSLVLTRHGNPSLVKWKMPLTILGVIGAIGAILFVVWAFQHAYQATSTFYPRVWI